MISREARVAFKERKKETKNKNKKRKVGLVRKMGQGKAWESFIRSRIFGPVGGWNSLSKRVSWIGNKQHMKYQALAFLI